jgi:hypothetical protein
MTKTITLTIGHNCAGVPTFTTREVCDFAADYLGVEAFTAYECFGMWRGEREDSTRIEVCGLGEAEAEEIRARVPLLAQALAQISIMCEIRPDRVEFVERAAVEAAKRA